MAEHDAADLGLAEISDPANCLITIRMVRSKKYVIVFLKAAVLISLIVYLEIAHTSRNRMRSVGYADVHIYIVFKCAAAVLFCRF